MTATIASRPAALTLVIEPHTEQWLSKVAAASAGSPPLYELSPKDARRAMRQVQASVSVQLQPADIDERVIPGGPTGQVSIRIVRSVSAAGMLPLVFHCHGGGWVLGDKYTHERLDPSSPTRPKRSSSSSTTPRHPKRTTQCRTSRHTPR